MNDTESKTDSLVAEIIADSLARRPLPAWAEEERESDWLWRVLHGEGDDD